MSSLVLFLLNCRSLSHVHYISLKCLSSLSLHICIYNYVSFLIESFFFLSTVSTDFVSLLVSYNFVFDYIPCTFDILPL
jgi:hypothetical protein